MRTVRSKTPPHQPPPERDPPLAAPLEDGTVMLSLMQAWIPFGLKAVEEAVHRNVLAVAGARSAHADGSPGVVRWGK